ncbi:MAG: CPBP family glutamic-type intramembrane protease [bacterium]
MMKKLTWEKADWYIGQTLKEESLCRIVPLFLVTEAWAALFHVTPPYTILLVLSSLIYGLAHLKLFRWPMAVACILFGFLLGWLFLTLPSYYGFITVIVIHFFVGFLAYWTGLTDLLEKEADND